MLTRPALIEQVWGQQYESLEIRPKTAMALVSVTGLGLLLYIRRRRNTGLVLAGTFAAACVVIFWWLV
ncbi:hypothetical protein [Verrucomicrobium sp. BvORR106]|uniref:hypothetical protein n=1 Tax=Verrucomicrobium sp. BvORR106 TaxID=1403819 RepID=UPI00068C7DF7|nr:hypothetical protein [Verrucomicrobium sp. BvORR106]